MERLIYMTLPNPTNVFSQNIGKRCSDGLHAFVSRAGIYTWKNAGEISHAVFPEVDKVCHSSATWADFAGDKLIIADIGVGIGLDGPGHIGELDVNTLEMSPLIQFGNNKSRFPVVKGFPNGSCVITSYTMEDTACFDISYRSPLTGLWSHQRHFHEPMSAIPASCWTIARGTDSLIYVFAVNDASCCMQLYRFAEDIEEGLVFVDEDTHFIDSSAHNGVRDPLAQMAELPELRAHTDHRNGRIVLICQKWPYTWECGRIQSMTQIIGVYPDKSKQLIGNIEKWSGHGNPAYVFPRHDGIYYALTYCKDCEPFERFQFGGFLNNGNVVVSPENPPCNPYMAVSVDGWVVRRLFNAETPWIEEFEIGKLPLPPELTIKDLGNKVELNWDQKTLNDTVDGSQNRTTWTPLYTGLPPFTVTKNFNYEYYRVVQPNSIT